MTGPASHDPKEILGRALEHTNAAERIAYLNKACQGNPTLRGEIESLLRAHEHEPQFLEEGPAGTGGRDKSATGEYAGTVMVGTATERPGAVLCGRYKLLEIIGEGGMGTVWVAQQTEPVRRRVALKVIKPGMDTRQVLSRFEAERQALALMDHPNIARVFDGGMTEQGRPFFAMEYVKGVPITTYCDECRLSLRERLELFVPVCQAVQHAHHKGIIHRDLKPTNILICLYDGKPVPKVIDFGLAKATHQPLTERTLYTAHGMMVGTPTYMSPEQAEFNNLDIDTRTDVYSLGVILYELLTGSTPLDRQQFKDAAWQEIVRLIKEAEPSKPSTKLTGSQSLPTLAAQRKLEPAQLSRLVRGDLDWIVMKALEKDRGRRYETANGFARDVQRYLADELVEARPPSAGYRLRKVIRRNKAVLTTVALVGLALIVGTVVSTWQAVRATRAERRVTEERDRAVVAEAQATHERDRAVAAEGRALRSLNAETAARQEAQENLSHARGAVEEFFTLVGQNKLFNQPSLQPLRLELLEAAIRYYESMVEQRPDDASLMADLAAARLRTAPLYSGFDREDDSIDVLSAALDDVERLRARFPDSKSLQLRLAGFFRAIRGADKTKPPRDVEKAGRTLRRLVQTLGILSEEHPDAVEFRSDLAAGCYVLARHQLETGHLTGNAALMSEGFETAERGIALWSELYTEHPDVPDYPENLIEALSDAAYWYRQFGKGDVRNAMVARAAELIRECVDRFPRNWQFHNLYAGVINGKAKTSETRGDYRHADQLFQEQLELAERLCENFPGVPRNSYLICRACMGRIRVAAHLDRSAEDVQALKRRIVAELANMQRLSSDVIESPDELLQFARTLDGIGGVLNDSGNRQTAALAYRQSVQVWSELADRFPDDPIYRLSLAHAKRWHASFLSDDARCDAYFEAERILVRLHGDDPENDEYLGWLIDTRTHLVGAFLATGRRSEADERVTLILAECDRLPAEDPDRESIRSQIAKSANNLVWSHVSAPDVSVENANWCLPIASRAVKLRPEAAHIWNTLGVAQCRVGDWDAAEEALRKAMELNDGGWPADWFFLAIADAERGDSERARHWFDAATFFTAKYAAENQDLLRFRREAIQHLGIPEDPLPREVDVAMIGEALSAADPDLECYFVIKGRAEMHLRRFEWVEAKDDFVRAAAMREKVEWVQYQLATLLARAGDEEAYRAHRRYLLDQLAETEVPMWAERISKACLLLPVEGDDLEAACGLAEKAVSVDADHWVLPFAQQSAALAAYRRGDWQGAVEWCHRTLEKESEGAWFLNAAALFIRASALLQLDRPDSAAADYAQGVEILELARTRALARDTVDPKWHEIAICELLRAETEIALEPVHVSETARSPDS